MAMFDQPIPPDEQHTAMMADIARSLARQFHPDIDANDVFQTLFVKWFEDFRYISRYLELEDEGQRTAAIRKTLANAGVVYCQAEKAAIRGYQPEDLFFYSKNALRELLPHLDDVESFTSLAVKGERVGRSSKPAHEGGDILAMMSDLRAGWDRLRQEQRDILWAALVEPISGAPYASLGAQWCVTDEAAYMRVDRALGALQRVLGGARPVDRRRAVSNAQAQSMTRADYGGE